MRRNNTVCIACFAAALGAIAISGSDAHKAQAQSGFLNSYCDQKFATNCNTCLITTGDGIVTPECMVVLHTSKRQLFYKICAQVTSLSMVDKVCYPNGVKITGSVCGTESTVWSCGKRDPKTKQCDISPYNPDKPECFCAGKGGTKSGGYDYIWTCVTGGKSPNK